MLMSSPVGLSSHQLGDGRLDPADTFGVAQHDDIRADSSRAMAVIVFPVDGAVRPIAPGAGTPSPTLDSLVFQASKPGVTSMGSWVIASPCRAARRRRSITE